MRATAFAFIALLLLSSIGSASAQVLYRFNQVTLFDGRFGPVAKAQEKASIALTACGRSTALTADGKFGPGTKAALAALSGCPNFAALASDADARGGALTVRYWELLVGEAAPKVDDRARTIMLTYEATDYTRMEWNFCQSRPLYNPAAGQRICFSNDPKSYLTWGPNGATGGGGHEVQLILRAVDAANPALINENFGAEAAAVRRMFQMRDRDDARSLETFLCGVWADTRRRAAWKAGFETLGRIPMVRATFDDFYRSKSLDGGKIETFYRAYAENSLVPTEIDYAFFKDRAAHTSPVLGPIKDAIARLRAAEPGAARWKVRQAIALNVRPANQRADRLGRDVAFYMDGAGSLGAEELSAWTSRGRVRASDAGLSDERSQSAFTPGPAIDTAISNPATLTGEERAACPQAVLDTRRPPQ